MMDYIEQGIDVLIENKVDYRKIDNYDNNENEKMKINNIGEFFKRIKNKKDISIIIGSNGIGKSYLLKKLKEEFECEIVLVELKKYESLESIKCATNCASQNIIFDGLDEININIQMETLKYILGLKGKNIIVSSRKDFAQKMNLIGINYNVYELRVLEDNKVNEILGNNGLQKENFIGIYNLLKIPRFLNYLLSIELDLKENKRLTKLDLMEKIIDKHFSESNDRAVVKIEINIHKKILQSLALVIMMMGKSNITTKEFTIFISNINHLDIKNYLLNKDIFESFLNNQLLLNNNFIAFENKEIMEFLAANEIYENNIANKDLFDMVTFGENNEINPLWFNTISYLTSISDIYYNLIINYVLNNLKSNDNLLELLLHIDIKNNNNNIVTDNIKNIVFQYTKLYQYLPFYDKTNRLYKILLIDEKKSMKELTNILLSGKLELTNKFNEIFINNILSCINYLLDNYSFNKTEKRKLTNYLIKNEQRYIKNDKFVTRYLKVCLQIFEKEDIDNMLTKNEINLKMLSVFLYDEKHWNKMYKINKYLNNYILNYKTSFNEKIFIDSSTIANFICQNYNNDRIRQLVNEINSNERIASFIRFLNSNKTPEFWSKLSNRSIVKLLYDKIICKLYFESISFNQNLRDMIWLEYRNGNALEKIINSCVNYGFVTKDFLDKEKNSSNFIVSYLKTLIIKAFLVTTKNVQMVYELTENKQAIFDVWKSILDNEIKNELEPQIKKCFPEELTNYNKDNIKSKNKDYAKLEMILNETNSNSNIHFKIKNIYELINNNNYLSIIDSNIIIKNIIKKIVKEIEDYILDVNVDTIYIKENKNCVYEMSVEFYYYQEAIEILFKMGYDINKYNEKNIILLNKDSDVINPRYKDIDFEKLLSYIKNKERKMYIKHYISSIIEKLKKYNEDLLTKMIFVWLEDINFNEYEINNILSFVVGKIETLNATEIKKLSKFRKYKNCQDVLIQLGYKSEIEDRVKYIENNLVFEGDSADEKSNFEYLSESYTYPLTKLDFENKNYIFELLTFMFDIYNKGNYYYFSNYILNMTKKYIDNNKRYNMNDIIDYILSKEKENKDRYLYRICNDIASLKQTNEENIFKIINNYNMMVTNSVQKIYSYDDLYEVIKNVLKNDILEDLKKMNFFEIFKDKKTKKIKPLNEETYQFLIGYELSRKMIFKNFSTEIIYESMSMDKKRSDIQLITEGFIKNIVIETKLSNNPDISNKGNVKSYVSNTLKKYSKSFKSPRILFIIINQQLQSKNFAQKIDMINNNIDNFVDVIPIDLKRYF